MFFNLGVWGGVPVPVLLCFGLLCGSCWECCLYWLGHFLVALLGVLLPWCGLDVGVCFDVVVRVLDFRFLVFGISVISCLFAVSVLVFG